MIYAGTDDKIHVDTLTPCQNIDTNDIDIIGIHFQNSISYIYKSMLHK